MGGGRPIDSDEEIIGLRKRLESVGRRWGLGDEARDFASDVLLRRLEGIGLTQTPLQSLIDYFRRTNRGTRGGRVRDAVSCGELGIDGDRLAALIPDNRTQDFCLGGSKNLQEIERLCSGLKTRDRASVILWLVWGFTAAEIGFLFGVTESRISQVWTKAAQVLAKRMENDAKANALQLRGAINSIEFQPALESLGAIERPMLLLSVIYGFDSDDLGFVFGISEFTAKSRLTGIRAGVASVLNYETLTLHQKKREERDKQIEKDRRTRARLKAIEQRMDRAREQMIDKVLFQKHREGKMKNVAIEENVTPPKSPMADFVMPEIEETVPIPVGSQFGPRAKSPIRLLAEKMQVGQSVVLEEAMAKRLYSAGKPTKKKFTARSVGEGKFRVWCTALLTQAEQATDA